MITKIIGNLQGTEMVCPLNSRAVSVEVTIFGIKVTDVITSKDILEYSLNDFFTTDGNWRYIDGGKATHTIDLPLYPIRKYSGVILNNI